MKMFPEQFEIVIHTHFGGFTITDEMAEWLRDNKDWTIFPKERNARECIQEFGLSKIEKSLFKYGKDFYFYMYDSNCHKLEDEYRIKLRTNQDFIDCVRFLQEKYKDLSYEEERKNKIMKLEIKTVKISLEIEDYYDGKERISGDFFISQ